ncbi:MAG: excinuclease ATPase subunit [Rubrivivax sp.]|nr:MAG: excinuclease ATPase subunit [Rubrivivax sp.]
MKPSIVTTWVAGALLGLSVAGSALARDTELHLPFQDVLDSQAAKEKLDGSVKFYLAGEKTAKVISRKNSVVANKKTNGMGKEDELGCRWAALSALIAFQEQAKKAGANAVVDIVSYYKRDTFKSATEYECHGGALIIGVALKGTLAKVALPK